ncbi:MAG TPA: HNH endonuclease [Candidatus Bathyarchaeia archaeon]|nr:HNH endonuclease [Candidatus Bathyarchaeia archaeon]
MKVFKPKQPRLKLPMDAYEQLRQQVLKRDHWRCQNCGCRQNLEVHHKGMRSHGGDDSDGNLITLCHSCHANEHDGS